jgi:hypothetical protein
MVRRLTIHQRKDYKMDKKQGLVIPKNPSALPPKEVRWNLPGDLWAAIEKAAQRNGVDPIEVARFGLAKALRSELAEVRTEMKG